MNKFITIEGNHNKQMSTAVAQVQRRGDRPDGNAATVRTGRLICAGGSNLAPPFKIPRLEKCNIQGEEKIPRGIVSKRAKHLELKLCIYLKVQQFRAIVTQSCTPKIFPVHCRIGIYARHRIQSGIDAAQQDNKWKLINEHRAPLKRIQISTEMFCLVTKKEKCPRKECLASSLCNRYNSSYIFKSENVDV